MPASVVAYGLPGFLGDGGQVGYEGVHFHGEKGIVPIEGGVEVVDVGLVVLPMVNLHGPAVNVRFQGIGRIIEIW